MFENRSSKNDNPVINQLSESTIDKQIVYIMGTLGMELE